MRIILHVALMASFVAALLLLTPPLQAGAGVQAGAGIQSDSEGPVDFENEVMPILTKFGCNSGPCHGKSRGQGGFQLSLLGFDPDFDFDAIVKEGRGRRLFPASPENSLLLRKPTGQSPHGGGRRLDAGGDDYQLLLRWIREGLPRHSPNASKLIRVSVSPESLVLKYNESQPLTVTAHYEDGTTRDVTRLTQFQSNESPIAGVTESGVVQASMITGEAAIMARFLGHIAVCVASVPMPGEVSPDVYAQLPVRNFIDKLVYDKLARLGITPSAVCDDHTFLRRVTTDICGRVPRPDEVERFLSDTDPAKRSKLIDQLLLEPDFADHWANKWVDLLRPNPYRVGIKTVLNYDNWIRQSFRERRPWDEFARELLTAQGSTFREGSVTLYRDRRTPDELTTMVSQLFLGVRLECAKCHHHPFEIWSQDDFYSFAAYFAKLDRKGTGVSPPISGSEEFIFAGKSGVVNHPVNGKVMTPKPLFGLAEVTEQTEDPREVLANWIVSPDNHLFSQVMANRVWADMMGRGLVEPVDDFRGTNPPSNAELMTALGNAFRDSDYSLTDLIRLIANSQVYQLSSLPSDRNVADTRYYSRHYRHRLRAEVLLDAFAEISGVPQRFAAMPPDTNARQIWTHRTESLFLDTFGRPDPNQDPPCERTSDSTVVQSLHLMNSEELHRDLTSENSYAALLSKSEKTAAEIVSEIYRRVYARNPSPEESAFAEGLFAAEGADRRMVIEDLMWAMLNSPEFVLQD
ncbi:MAG: DUF1553 domain-containing protein [Planctomyces sp.]|nr:DUF1553 domain-containing protein [Planctomyces sp.]